ncbi:MAG: transcriptional regulator [Actinobacteria bacterium 13_2_20CM_2_71_6]|nr:MAG: transcriptional regulator [Actinobacteria bacterium 13_2_20CM_2_71_6]
MTAQELVETVRKELSLDGHENRLVAAVAQGRAPLGAIAALAAEETRIVASDRRSFLLLAARATEPSAVDFFSGLAQGEGMALVTLPALAAAAGLDETGVRAYRVRAGCQAYPAYVAWLAVNGDPVDVILATLANFAAWGDYCAALARALREHYGFDDAACGFFDFFATPAGDAGPSELEAQALAAIDARLGTGDPLATGREYGRLLQSYELMFWNTLADAG